MNSYIGIFVCRIVIYGAARRAVIYVIARIYPIIPIHETIEERNRADEKISLVE